VEKEQIISFSFRIYISHNVVRKHQIWW